MQVQDTVQRVISRKTPRAVAYTVQLQNEGYIGVGFQAPPCEEGDMIELQYELNDRGYKQMVKGTMKVIGSGKQESTAPQPAPQSAQAGGQSKQGYWDEKAKKDLETQRAIQYQASRNAALEVAKMALENDCISLGAKKAAKLDILMAFIDETTDRFNKDVTDFVQNGERSDDYGDTQEAQEVGDFE